MCPGGVRSYESSRAGTSGGAGLFCPLAGSCRPAEHASASTSTSTSPSSGTTTATKLRGDTQVPRQRDDADCGEDRLAKMCTTHRRIAAAYSIATKPPTQGAAVRRSGVQKRSARIQIRYLGRRIDRLSGPYFRVYCGAGRKSRMDTKDRKDGRHEGRAARAAATLGRYSVVAEDYRVRLS